MNERSRRVIALRVCGLSCAEIGRELGVSGSRVAAIVRHAAWDESIRLKMEAAGVAGVLSRRTYLTLVRAGLSIEATRAMADDDLLRLPNVGEGTLAEIRRATGPQEVRPAGAPGLPGIPTARSDGDAS